MPLKESTLYLSAYLFSVMITFVLPNVGTTISLLPRSSALYGGKSGPDFPGFPDHRGKTPW